MNIDQAIATLEIQNTQGKYMFHFDHGNSAGLREILHEDVEQNFGPFGGVNGIEDAMDFFEAYKNGETIFNDFWHMVGTPWIEAEGNDDGDEGVARCYLTGAFDLDGVGACWLMGTFRNEFRKVDGEWQITATNYTSKYITPATEGWDRTPVDLSFKRHEQLYED
jgi:hypothetical protein